MRGKTMFLRLFLTLLLMAGLTVDFHTMSLGFGTAVYAFDDEEDEYEDDDDDDDDDGYFEGWDFNDFVNYIESGEAEDDGIEGNVWTDYEDFMNNADPEVVEDALEALEILESEGCCESSDGGNSESTQTSSEQGKQESGTENNGEKLIEEAIRQANEQAQEAGFDKSDLTSYDITTTQTENGVEVHLEAHYESTSATSNDNGDEVGHIDFSNNEFNVSIHVSDDSGSSSGSPSDDDGNYDFGGHGEGDASGVASYGDSGYGDEGGNGYGDGGDGLIYPGEEVADSGYGGNDNGGFPDDGGDYGSIENIPADDEGGYEPTDNTPSTTEPEPTTQEEDYECEGEQCDICGGYKSEGIAFRSSGGNAPNCPACTCVKTPMPDCDSITTYTGLLINTTEYKAALESMRTLSNSGTSACRLLFDNGIDEQNGLSRNLSVGDTYSDLGSAMSAKKSSEDVVGVVYSVGEGQHMLTDRQMLDLVKYSTRGFSTAYVVDGSHVYAVRFENFNMSQTYLSKYEGYILDDGEFDSRTGAGKVYSDSREVVDGVLEAKSAMYNYMDISLSLLQSNTSKDGDLLFSKINSCYSLETEEVYTETCGEGGGK